MWSQCREPLGGAVTRRGVFLSLSRKKSGARASKEAAAALRFLRRLTVPEGRRAGKPLRLATFQKDFVRGAFAKDVGIALLSIGRGNAKTALAAGLSLGHLMGEIAPQPKREIIFAARNRDQARTAFAFLVGFIEGLDDDEQEAVAEMATNRNRAEKDLENAH